MSGPLRLDNLEDFASFLIVSKFEIRNGLANKRVVRVFSNQPCRICVPLFGVGVLLGFKKTASGVERTGKVVVFSLDACLEKVDCRNFIELNCDLVQPFVEEISRVKINFLSYLHNFLAQKYELDVHLGLKGLFRLRDIFNDLGDVYKFESLGLLLLNRLVGDLPLRGLVSRGFHAWKRRNADRQSYRVVLH